MKKVLLSLIGCAMILGLAAGAHAVTVGSNNQGWVNSNGTGNGGYNGQNTFTGNEGAYFNSWASFDLSSTSTPVTDAKVHLNLARWPQDAPEPYTLDLHDVSTPLASFLSSTSGYAGYFDLGNGNLYGTVTGSNGEYYVTLSAQAVADINSSLGGSFLIGFTNVTLNQFDPSGASLGSYINGFYGNPNDAPELMLNSSSVPEPSTFLLLGAGLGGLALLRRRK